MLEQPTRDRRAERHETTRAEILETAWEQARANGVAALSLRDLARAIGMQPPSLYSYFDSKHAIYDAMYAQGAQQFVDEQQESMPTPDDPLEALKAGVHFFVEFCAADFARYQLLFQRTIPGFEPSAESYALALEFYELGARFMRAAGVRSPAEMDMFTALVSGLAHQQIANEPGGRRCGSRLVEELAEAVLHGWPSRPRRGGWRSNPY